MTKPIFRRADNESPLPLPALLFPRLLRIQDAAKYLSATTWQIETLLREGEIPSFILGKRRVVDRLELTGLSSAETMKCNARNPTTLLSQVPLAPRPRLTMPGETERAVVLFSSAASLLPHRNSIGFVESRTVRLEVAEFMRDATGVLIDFTDTRRFADFAQRYLAAR